MINIKKWIAGILLFDLVVVFWACNHVKQTNTATVPTNTEKELENTNEEGDVGELYVLMEVDQEEKSITIFNVRTLKKDTFFYTGATSVKNRYDKETSMAGLPIGEMVDVALDSMTETVSRVKISEKAWEYQKVQNMKTVSGEKRIQIGDRNYRYNDHLLVFSGEERIDLMAVNDVDELTVKGVEETIYSIQVTKGHGYIRPMNYEGFVGGMVSVGNGVIKPITEDMLIIVREGNYNVTMQNGDFNGTKYVTVTRNVETELDMGDFKPEVEHVGMVEFDISPYGADLYVNGKLTDYDEPVSLNYGKHQVRVTLTGYEDYFGILNVQTPSPTIRIDLAEDVAEVDEENDDSDTSIDGTDQKDNVNVPDSVNGLLDKDHTIKVSEPSGVSVYFDGTYMGVAPCSFVKQIGTHTITLSKEGYTTKSYTIQIVNDEENVEWKFPSISN